MLDAWFDLPYWVVDILPEQVPGGSRGQYFAVEQFYLQPTRMADLHRRFADMLLKLNCYDDFAVYSTDEKAYGRNPSPERLFSLLCQEQADLCIVLPDEHAMIAVNHDDTCMTVYHPSETLRHRIAQLAGAEGLFFCQPPDAKGNAL